MRIAQFEQACRDMESSGGTYAKKKYTHALIALSSEIEYLASTAPATSESHVGDFTSTPPRHDARTSRADQKQATPGTAR